MSGLAPIAAEGRASRSGRAIASALDAARGRTVSTALGGMLSEYIRLLESQLPSLTDEDARGLPQAVAAMVAACLAPSVDRITTAQGQISATLKDKARRCILRNLSSPHLGANMLCRELGMSRSSLYRLLETEGGVDRYIQRHRLAESFAQLSDPSNTQPIVVIAVEAGDALHPLSVVHFAGNSASARLMSVSPREPVLPSRSLQHVEMLGAASGSFCPSSSNCRIFS